MNWIKKQKRGNCDIIQDVSPISEARACNIVPLEIVYKQESETPMVSKMK
jgi:hypothetical protein